MYNNNNNKNQKIVGNITIHDKCYPSFIKISKSKNGKCDIVRFLIRKVDENKREIYSFNCSYCVYSSNQPQIITYDKTMPDGRVFKMGRPIFNIKGQWTTNEYQDRKYNNLFITDFKNVIENEQDFFSSQNPKNLSEVFGHKPVENNKDLNWIDEEQKEVNDGEVNF